ncbi:hypothetical protein KUL10_30120 [Glaciecola sp. KUL10]|nr:hypothetical protein KUL10_30120 [Glaciecola sp. KUL10]
MVKGIQMTEQNIENKDRRQFIDTVSKILGATASAVLLSGASVQHAFAFKGLSASDQFLNKQMLDTLIALSDTVLPQTSTPSASQVGCHDFVQSQLVKVHGSPRVEECKLLIRGLDTTSQNDHDKAFYLLNQTQKLALLTTIENSPGNPLHGSLSFIKSLIVFGYFTSKVGASQVLRYQAVPGGFKGSIKIDENTPGWGSLDFY